MVDDSSIDVASDATVQRRDAKVEALTAQYNAAVVHGAASRDELKALLHQARVDLALAKVEALLASKRAGGDAWADVDEEALSFARSLHSSLLQQQQQQSASVATASSSSSAAGAMPASPEDLVIRLALRAMYTMLFVIAVRSSTCIYIRSANAGTMARRRRSLADFPPVFRALARGKAVYRASRNDFGANQARRRSRLRPRQPSRRRLAV